MLKQKVLNTIKQNNLIENGDRIVVGVSGGPDSICLLSILNDIKEELGFEIYVCHINHGLRGNAILDEKYVIDFCKAKNIECFVKKADVKSVAKENKIGTEEARKKYKIRFL